MKRTNIWLFNDELLVTLQNAVWYDVHNYYGS